ncbi:hypothetical protein [Photobacterium kishitanii]|uniref:hypothetical protein n=1 Tax=Photobacterium kishitanii TaxID=318456 RepID=UPI002738FA9E|nr:hypothetical protein [Photobacterium kishitanii]
MTLDIIDNIGSMDESLFIDYVDTEWCLRAGKKGIKFFVCNNINMRHEIGSANIHFLKWRIPVHNPARRYYRIRNSFYLFKYPHVHNIIAFREVFFSIIHQLILILICKDKVKNIKFLFSAVFSGLKAVFLNYIISFKRNGKYS